MVSITAAKRFYAFGILAMLAGFFVFSVASAEAVTIVPACARNPPGCTAGGNCPPPSLDCALATFRNVASLIVGVTGSFALLMFVYGGFMLLTSGGVEAKVSTGKTILKNALIGIVLVFTAGYIIDYAVKHLQISGRVVREGDACNNGHGRYAIISGRGAVCQTPCADPSLRSAGYACMPPSEGSGCNVDYTGCGTSTGAGARQCCVANCGDAICGAVETAENCPVDCGSGASGTTGGETASCGDGLCAFDEDSTSCPSDCAPAPAP